MKGIFYDIPKEYKYSVAFTSEIKTIDKETAQKYISLASQADLKKHLPNGFNLDEKADCLGIAGQAFNVNKLNLNDDGVDNATAARICDLFPLSYIDKFHRRNDILGVILTASFVDSETNQEITKEEALKTDKPYTCVVGGIIWKLADEKLSDAIEESNDVNSKFYGKLYFSWELAFSDVQIIELPKGKTDFKDGQIITTADKIQEYNKLLKANGGSGQLENGNKIGRVIVGQCLPLGVGIVENPAGQLSPIVSEAQVVDDKVENIIADKLDNSVKQLTESLERVVKKTIETNISMTKLAENFTKAENSVIEIKSNINIMDKLTKITDLNDTNIKECKADTVIDLFNNSIKEADIKWQASQKEAEEKAKSLTDAQKELNEVKANLEALQNKIAAQEAQTVYNQRMTYFDDTYELAKEERQAIAEDISVDKNIDNDTFNKIKSKYDIFLKDKNKETIEAKKKEFNFKKKEEEEEKTEKEGGKKEEKKESKASLEDEKKIIDAALDNGNQDKTKIPNVATPEQSLTDKFSPFFKIEDCIEVRKM